MPEYNTDFNIGDFEKEMNALINASTIQMPDEMMQFVVQRVFDLIKLQSGELDEDVEKKINLAISNFRKASVVAPVLEQLM